MGARGTSDQSSPRLVQGEKSVGYRVPQWPGTQACRDDTAVVVVLCIGIYESGSVYVMPRHGSNKRPSEQRSARILD